MFESAFFTGYIWPTIIIVAQCLAVTIPLLVAVAYMTYVDRKVWAAIQLRRGPNVVGPFGLLQPMADGLKLCAALSGDTTVHEGEEIGLTFSPADAHVFDTEGRVMRRRQAPALAA